MELQKKSRQQEIEDARKFFEILEDEAALREIDTELAQNGYDHENIVGQAFASWVVPAVPLSVWQLGLWEKAMRRYRPADVYSCLFYFVAVLKRLPTRNEVLYVLQGREVAAAG